MIVPIERLVPLKQTLRSDGDTDSSLLAPRYPPGPMEMAPAVNPASPVKITTLVFPSVDSPAASANGTVNPSERPMIASPITLALRPDFSDSCSTSRSVLAFVEATDAKSVDLRSSASWLSSRAARLALTLFGLREKGLDTQDEFGRPEVDARRCSFMVKSSGSSACWSPKCDASRSET